MKCIIAGSRHIDKIYAMALLYKFIIRNQSLFNNITEIVSGGAPGVDQAAEFFAENRFIDFKCFPADWSQGKKAGPLRNRQMAEYADVLILVWDGKTRGSASMKREMERLKKPVYEIIV